MPKLLHNFEKLFESRIRLGIMSMLMVEEWVHYSSIKKTLATDKPLTDGNLASHIKKLKEAEFIEEQKAFINRKPHTTYRATPKGKKIFHAHLDALEDLIKRMGK